MKKFFSGLCISLAVILALGGLGFGSYKLFNKPKSNKPTYADDVAKIYNVDVKAFNYGLGDIENVMQDGVLVSNIVGSNIQTPDDVCRLFDDIFINRFVYHDPNDSEAVGEVFEGGRFSLNSSSGITGTNDYVIYSIANSGAKFYVYYKVVDDGIIFRFSKTVNITAGAITNPNNTHDCFEYEFEDGYVGKNVVFYNNAKFFKAYYATSSNITANLSTTEMASILNEMFLSITDINTDLIYTTSMGGYGSNPVVYSNGWYGFSQPGTASYPHSSVKIIARFVDGGVYLVPIYYPYAGAPSGSNLEPCFDLFSSEELAEQTQFRYLFAFNEGYEFVGTKVLPYLNNSYFFKGFQVTSGESNYTFSNLNQAKEMLGIKDEDGAFSMTGRTDAEDYIEYVFNLKTDNMSLDFKVKVYKDNVCVLDYNKYYYVDKDGNVQTFSVEDITKENSPFVYFYETQTDYYYLRRVDVLTSYQLKISKEILNLELTKEVA